MIVLSGADLVLPGGIQRGGTLVIDGDRIVDVLAAPTFAPDGATVGKPVASASAASPLRRDRPVDLSGHVIVPGFIDVHVHGLEGRDSLDGPDAIGDIAGRLPKYGVTAFCPTTVACSPDALREVLRIVADLRSRAAPAAARVLPAHLESNFINPEYKGAQPAGCLRTPPQLGATGLSRRSGEAAKADARSPQPVRGAEPASTSERGWGPASIDKRARDFDGADILAEIDRAGASVGIVTLAPELDGALDLIRHLVARGRRVSLGHSGASLAQARAAIGAGARHATHLFNRMPPLNHREPGLAGAVLTSDEIAAEIICDGVHVHRDMVRMAVSVKGAERMMAITDGVAAAGLPAGAAAFLGGQMIRVERSAACLADGTLAGSIATMDRVFRFLVQDVGLSLNDTVQLCAMTPATELNLTDLGALRKGAVADIVVLDRDLRVKQTYVEGRLVYDSQ